MSSKYHLQVEKYLKAQQTTHSFLGRNKKDYFFLKIEGNGTFLYHLDLSTQGSQVDLTAATRLLDEDFSKRSLEFKKYFEEEKHLYFTQDQSNNEFPNLFRMSLDPQSPDYKKIQQLTEVKAFRAPVWNKKRDTLYFQNRFPIDGGMFKTEFYKLDLRTFKSELLFNDQDWEYKSGWSGFILTPDEKSIIYSVDFHNRRELLNFVRINFEEVSNWVSANKKYEFPEPARLLPQSFEDGNLGPFEEVNPQGFYFYSESSKFMNFYFCNFSTTEIVPLTNEKWINISHTTVNLEGRDKLVIAAPLKESAETRLCMIDLETLDRTEKVVTGNYVFGFGPPFIYKNSIDAVPTFSLFNENFETLKSISKYIGEDLVHGSYQHLKYKSFDGLEIFAYLTLPKKPLRAVVVTAFYGGENYYHIYDQLLLENGIGLFSPAVRGSWGWGKDWEDHLKGDLGGKEILDVIYGAKFISKHLNLLASKIGIEGGSHGGYAALRALTMPDKFAGVDARFDFAFGICECGFADLEDMHGSSRIADWLVDLLGEYPKNKDLYRERSPIHYFQNLKTPLFIRHGTTDTRVPLSTMTGFIEKLKASSVKHKILIQENQGHHTNDPEKIKYERALILEFLDEVLG